MINKQPLCDETKKKSALNHNIVFLQFLSQPRNHPFPSFFPYLFLPPHFPSLFSFLSWGKLSPSTSTAANSKGKDKKKKKSQSFSLIIYSQRFPANDFH